MPPNLLNDDGTASMATALMMSHHAFRRDLARYLKALDSNSLDASTLQPEWQWYRTALHGHHHAEDTGIFPSLRTEQPTVAATIDKLAADHQRIDPLLTRGDAAFADLGNQRAEAVAVLRELSAFLEPHLAIEEAEIVGFLRGAKTFPTPASEEEANMYVQGFAWACNGIAPDVIARVDEMLPETVLSRLPAARSAYNEKCAKLWVGEKVLASRTPVP